MGFLSSIVSFASSAIDTVNKIFSSSSGGLSFNNNNSTNHNSNSSVQTLYEPDRVKIAEWESKKATILIDGQQEIIKLNAKMQMSILEANIRGFEYSANILKSINNDINIMAQERLELLENGHIEVVNRIETLYLSFEKEIKKDNDNFQLNKLTQMCELLNKFPADSISHKIYSDSIIKQINLNISFVGDKLKALKERQHILIESSLESKKIILAHSNKIVEERMKFLETQIEKNQFLLSNSTQEIENNTPLLEIGR